MNCFDAQERIIDLMLGELTPEDEVLLKEHIDECPMCRQEFEFLSDCFQICTDEKNESCDCHFQEPYWDEFVSTVHEKITHEKMERRFPFQIVLPIAASVLVVAAVGYYFFLRPAPKDVAQEPVPKSEHDPYEEVYELTPEETEEFIKMINQKYSTE